MRGERARGGVRTAAFSRLWPLAGGLVVGAALAGCGSGASQEPPGTPASVEASEASPPEAGQGSAPKPATPASAAAATSSEPPASGGAHRDALAGESRAPEEDNFGTHLRDFLIARREKSRRVAECNRLISVMNSEGAKLSPKGSATDPSTMTTMADDLDSAGTAMAGVKLSLPKLVSFRDRSVALFRDVARAARSSGEALRTKDLAAATKALKELTESAQANTALITDINAYCQAD